MIKSRKPPFDAVPNFKPLALERMMQLSTTTFWQICDGSCDLKQIPSSAASKKELLILTLSQSTISIPSLFQ